MIQIKNPQYFHFLQQADALRRSGLLCDAVISVKTQTFRVHRLVLACASRTLAQHFTQGDRVTQVHCNLECFSPHTFQQVLDFTYTQALHVSADDLPLLLRAAQLLQMPLLEDECKKQLDSLHCSGTEQGKGREVIEVKEEQENTNKEEKQKEEEKCLAKKDLQERSSPAEKNSDKVLVEYLEPVLNSNNANSLPFTRKKSHCFAESEPVCSRGSVITRPTSSISSFSSPWTLSTDMWESVSSLRRTAENYSNMVTATPHQPINPFSAAQPFSPSSPHMFNLLSSQLPTPVQSSSISYSGLHPHYTQNLLIGSTRIGSIITEGLLKRKKPSQREVTKNVPRDEPSFLKVSKSNADSERQCEPHSTDRPDDSVIPDSASSQTDSCASCHCGRGDVSQSQSRRDVKGEKPHQCRHCPKKFSLKHQLDTHHRVHTGEKPFECRLCGQRSRDYSAMIKHLRTHNGASPYQCTVCLEFCNSLVAMQKHIRNHAVHDFPPDWNISCTYLYISHI